MAKAKNGDVVKVHYTGRLQEDGTVFDSSVNRDPLEFTLGNQQLLPKFEETVIGMEVGEKATVDIVADDAYGPHYAEGVGTVDRSEFPPDAELEIGMQFQAQLEDGRVKFFRVIGIEGEKVTLDGNHPLAGKDLTFDIELMELTEK